MKKVEVIAWSLQDAIDIEKSGAHRIELVSDLDKGGLTPDLDLVVQIVNLVNIPVRVMVRDNDESFVYSDEQMNNHLSYIKKLTKIAPEGIVFGSLTSEGKINFNQLKKVIEVKGNMKLTFHRAFDEISESILLEEFDKLTKYDVDTVLTSGTKSSALEGKEILKTLIAKHKINILPGKSISLSNAKEIIDYTGADYIHVGYAVRTNNLQEGEIDKNKLKKLIESINN